MTIPSLKLTNISKSYDNVPILEDINIEFNKGMHAIIGKSGVGKSTFLYIAALLHNADSGFIHIGDHSYNSSMLSSIKNLHKVRRNNMSVIYQNHYLMNDFSVIDNIAMPLFIRGENREYSFDKAYDLLKSINMHNKAKQNPQTLSGGESQRVAILRSLIHDPDIIFADEPTGNLDQENTEIILDLLIEYMNKKSKIILIVTHDNEIMQKTSNLYKIEHKKLMAV
ncbi:MAG TPA: ATP-binding cassette domain-containing protein [Candidatus Megaira endosymbiont of Hartmannula sinica]|nr:ATP-binding cassette domain-containing protein [Candidatus Megaera endosymbiont of Hartmannula sinica]